MWETDHFADSVVGMHTYLDVVRPTLCNLDAANRRLSWHAGLLHKVSAAERKDERTPRKVSTAISDGIAQLKGQALLISILNDTDDPCTFEVDVGKVDVHAA